MLPAPSHPSLALKIGKNDERNCNEELLVELARRFAAHASFGATPLPHPGQPLSPHARIWGEPPDPVRGFVSQDADLLERGARHIALKRNSTAPFARKLFRGPSLAV
jgi:hypothetical protein